MRGIVMLLAMIVAAPSASAVGETKPRPQLCTALDRLADRADQLQTPLTVEVYKGWFTYSCKHLGADEANAYCKAVWENTSREFTQDYLWAVRDCLAATQGVRRQDTSPEPTGLRKRHTSLTRLEGRTRTGSGVLIEIVPGDFTIPGVFSEADEAMRIDLTVSPAAAGP
jgi:hypothetical protein